MGSILEKLKKQGKELRKNLPEWSEEEGKIRMEICRSCKYFRAKTGQCTQCGCFMVVKTKLKNLRCPIDKW